MFRQSTQWWFGPAILIALAPACNGSRDQLLADLQSPRPEERAEAVKRLAQKARPEDLVLFTQAAKDPVAIVREQAIVALGQSQDPRVVDLLGDLLSDSNESVQAGAAMALAEIKSDKAKAYLTMQYARRGRATRQAIVQALKSANVPGAMAQVVASEATTLWERNLKALNQGMLPERVGAAEELGKSGRAEAVSRLLPLIKDSQVVLAAAAVRGLGYAGDRRAVGPISELLTENFPELRGAACEALMRLQDSSALPQLTSVAMERSSASMVATTAIIALPKGEDTDRALCEVAYGAGAAEAVAAAREMRRRGGCPLESFLERLKIPAAQPSALHALWALGTSTDELIARLLPLLNSSDATVKRLALEVIAATRAASAADAVLKVYEQEHKAVQALREDWVPRLPAQYSPGFDPTAPPPTSGPDEQQRARQMDLFKRVQALQAMKAQAAQKAALHVLPPQELVDDVNEDQLRVLAASLRALGAVKAAGGEELLRQHTADPSPTVRAGAYAGLSFVSAQGLVAAAAGLLDADHEVQAQTALALAEQGEVGQAELLKVAPRLVDRSRILDALHRAGVLPAFGDALAGLIQDSGGDLVALAQLVGETGAVAAVEPLLRYLEDPTSPSRKEALLALGKTGDARAADMIGRHLYHDSPDVRAAAAEALALLKVVAHQDALDALKGDYYRRVRDAADAALAVFPPPDAGK